MAKRLGKLYYLIACCIGRILHGHVAIITKPSPPFPIRDVVLVPGLLPIFLHGCKIKSGSGLGTRLWFSYCKRTHAEWFFNCKCSEDLASCWIINEFRCYAANLDVFARDRIAKLKNQPKISPNSFLVEFTKFVVCQLFALLPGCEYNQVHSLV